MSTAIVNYLRQEHIPATFFVSGRWAEECPECLKTIASVPFFEIALHGYQHLHASDLNEQEIASEIERNQSTISKLGYKPEPYFRPPYGDCPPKLVAVAAKLGVQVVMWDVESGDPNPRNTAPRLDQRVLSLARNGSIVVMHVNDGGVWTAQTLPAIVAGLRERGFAFVSVSQLLRAPATKLKDSSEK